MNAVLGFVIASVVANTQVKVVELKDPFYVEESVIEVVNEPEIESEYDIVTFVTTAYCPCSKCCEKSDGITASGVKAQAGHTIAAPSSYYFGQQIEIDGIIYTVEDRGGAIKNNKIDIFFNTHSEAQNYGVRTVEGKVYK